VTITPSESEAYGQAVALLDSLCHAAGVFLTDTQRARALAEIDIRLEELRRYWARRFATEVLEQARDRDSGPPAGRGI
jgi:hypothetical protein